MQGFVKTIIAIIAACALLVAFWLYYRDSFDVDIPALATKEGCIQAVNDSESKVLTEFEKKALESIGGGNVDNKLPLPDKIDEWKPSIESLTLLFDTNAIVDMALSRFRASIAENQQSNPNSLVNKQKARISDLFETGRNWCKSLPK